MLDAWYGALFKKETEKPDNLLPCSVPHAPLRTLSKGVPGSVISCQLGKPLSQLRHYLLVLTQMKPQIQAHGKKQGAAVPGFQGGIDRLGRKSCFSNLPH